MQWTSNEESCVIDFFQAHACLWNYNDPVYYRKNRRSELLLELSTQLKAQGDGKEFTEKEIMKKWKYLRNSFVREVKKVETTSRSGAGTDQHYQTKWAHFDHMLFLKDVVKPKDSKDCGLSPAESSFEEVEEAGESASNNVEPEASSSKVTCQRETPKGNSRTSKKRRAEDMDELRRHSLQKCIEALEEKPKDGEHHFAMSIACQLRTFPTLEREKAKLEIIKLLLDFEKKIHEQNLA